MKQNRSNSFSKYNYEIYVHNKLESSKQYACFLFKICNKLSIQVKECMFNLMNSVSKLVSTEFSKYKYITCESGLMNFFMFGWFA